MITVPLTEDKSWPMPAWHRCGANRHWQKDLCTMEARSGDPGAPRQAPSRKAAQRPAGQVRPSRLHLCSRRKGV